MRAVVQRVDQASVTVGEETTGKIGRGFLVLLGVGDEDTPEDLTYLARKVVGLRVFEDERGLMSLTLEDIRGELLVVSQFTLYGDCRKGRRPSFSHAMAPAIAADYVQRFIKECESLGIPTAQGAFGEMMKVSLINDGPVTLLLDSKKQF